MSDLEYMKQAYALAEKGRGRTSPNPMVGAVVVKKGKIIGKGWHQRCGGPHAEMLALRQAGSSAQGAKLYVTLEPCFSFGRTPPCVDAVIRAGIKEVIVGMKDPNPKTNGRSLRKLRAAGVRVKTGFFEKELQELNEVFVKYIRHKMPFVATKTAQTLDGKIATVTGQSKWITSAAARAYAHRMRGYVDAIMVGANTVRKDDPSLNAVPSSRPLKKIILDPNLSISPRARIFQGTLPENCILAVSQKASSSKVKKFKRRGNQVIVAPGRKDYIGLRWLMRELARQEIASVLIEGGSRVVGSALREGIVDKMQIYLAPKIMGDERALSSVMGLKTPHLDQAVRLKNMTFKNVGGNILLAGDVVKNKHGKG